MAEKLKVLGTVRLRDQDAVEARLHDGREIVERKAGVERVDAHEEGPVARGAIVEQLRCDLPGCGLLRRRDGVLEVEDQRVRPRGLRLGELAFGIARNEQQRAQPHVGFLSMSATRRQVAMTSSR